MTQEEYRKTQAALPRYERGCVEKAQHEIKARLAAAAKEALKTGKIDHESLTDDLYAIYEKYRTMAADKALDIAERYLEDCIGAAGLKKNAQSKDDIKYGHRYKAEGTSWTGEWYKTDYGQTVFVTVARKLEFLRRYHLSDSERPMHVWDICGENASEAEERIFTVIEAGVMLGRDVKDVGRDLETLIKYKDGGSRVIGRWGAMVSPYNADGSRNEKAVKEGWEREYIKSVNTNNGQTPGDEGYIAYGSGEARELLREPKAQTWITERSISQKTGKTLLPPGARAYVDRLGKTGLDYRAVRVIRTESAVRFNEQQRDIARNSPAATGLVTRRLSAQRDAWKCECVEAKNWINEGGGKHPDKIPEEWQTPLHPNCGCQDMPVMKPMKQVIDEIMEKYFGGGAGGGTAGAVAI